MTKHRLASTSSTRGAGLELWGGHECTVNRVGDGYRDQSAETGHDGRWREDFARYAQLGLKRVRHPVLWERIAPDHPDRRDWGDVDARLAELKRLDLKPIVGLIHHGSGPRYTGMAEDSFVPLFAEHARAVAERFPWVEEWTPVNEPLTTARFAALYGHWHPHAMDEGVFWRCLMNEIEATVDAMAQIRRVNPRARLVQTDDLGQVFAIPELQAHADEQNERRWATWDLLAGRARPGTWLFERMAAHGLGDRLRALADAPCPPDVIGVNHYLTSTRFLDNRRERYPRWWFPEGGHADMESVRVLSPHPVDLKALLRQAWDRYGLPMAVTECHLGCTRDEQMRWLWEAWRHAGELRDEGVDVRAVTAWSLFGACDWDSLITQAHGRYEPGPYDVRGGAVRPTALADLIARLGAGQDDARILAAHPCLEHPGWWRRPIRLEHPVHDCGAGTGPCESERPAAGPPVLIAGSRQGDGRTVADACRLRGLAHAWAELDAESEADACAAALSAARPWAVVDVLHSPTLQQACEEAGVLYATAASHAPALSEEVHQALDLLLDRRALAARRRAKPRSRPPLRKAIATAQEQAAAAS